MDEINDNVAIHCRNLTKTYGAGAAQVFALRGVDLDVHTGELMMLVGPSGCGKTTLISVIAGILNQDSGECTIYGRDLRAMSQRDRTRYRGESIGFVFQAFNLLPTLTAVENAAVPLLVKGMKRGDAIERARDMLDRVGLASRAHALPREMSGGQQQRVAIARALVHDPKLIVCDEPTSALDHESGYKVMDLLREVAMKENRSLVIVTHDARIFEFADRIARLDDGRVLSVTEPAEELAVAH